MPAYDYVCKDCRKTFTLVMSLSEYDKSVPACPSCKGTNVDQKPATFFAVGAKKS